MMSRMLPMEIRRCTRLMSATARVIMSPMVCVEKNPEPCFCRASYSAPRRSKATRMPTLRTEKRAYVTKT